MRLALDAQRRPRRVLLSARSRRPVGPDLARELLDSGQETEAADRPPSATRVAGSGERAATAARRAFRRRSTCWRWPATWSARASGSSAATAGPTTSASAASTTSCARAATSTSWCSTPRCTPTPAARPPRRRPRGAVAKFAARRQGHRQEGPRRHRPRLRQRLRGAGLDGRQRRPDDQGAARGGGLAGTVAGHRLQHLHRPRHRHVQVDGPPEGRGRAAATGRSTASTPARSPTASRSSSTRRRPRCRCANSSPPRPASPSSSGRTPSAPPTCAALAQADTDERWRYYEQLAGMHRSVPHVDRHAPLGEPDGADGAGPARRRGGLV